MKQRKDKEGSLDMVPLQKNYEIDTLKQIGI
jgi:hypothetical protein